MIATKFKKAPVIALSLFLLLGLGLIGYPILSNLLASGDQSAVQAQYTDEVDDMTDTEIESELQAARLYNEALQSVKSTETIDLRAYDELLNLSGSAVMCTVEIPAIDVELPVYHGIGEEVLQKGAGHMPGTSLPVGGESTHAVISAHSGLPAARLFTDLDKLEEGNLFYIHVLGETLCYEVDQIVVTIPSDTEAIQIEKGQDYVTLLTCTPYGVNTHRLLVRGHRTEIPKVPQTVADEPAQPERASTWTEKYLQGIAFGVAGAALLIGGLVVIWRIRKKQTKL